MFGGAINSGLSASATTLQGLQNVFGTFLDNQQRQQGLFSSGLERARQDRADRQFASNRANGLDPLRNSLDLFNRADNATDARRALGNFTALRQPAASASLFDRGATGISGLAGTPTGLIQQGFGGLGAAFNLEDRTNQQNLALRLSEIGNRSLDPSQITGARLRPGQGFDTASLEAEFAKAIRAGATPEQAGRAAAAANPTSGFPGQSNAAPTATTPQGNSLIDDPFTGGTDPANGTATPADSVSPTQKSLEDAQTSQVELQQAEDAVILAKSSPDPLDLSRAQANLRLAQDRVKFSLDNIGLQIRSATIV